MRWDPDRRALFLYMPECFVGIAPGDAKNSTALYKYHCLMCNVRFDTDDHETSGVIGLGGREAGIITSEAATRVG